MVILQANVDRINELRRQAIVQAWYPLILISILATVIIYVATAIGLMKMFEKAGEKSWKAWIPVYNYYVLIKTFWSTKWFWVLIGAYAFIAIFGNLKVGNPLALIFAIVILLVLLGIFVINCFLSYHVAKSFNKSMAWVVGLIFLPWLFYLIIGFGSANYSNISASTAKKETTTAKMTLAESSTKKTSKTSARSNKNKAQKDIKSSFTQNNETDYIDPKDKIQF